MYRYMWYMYHVVLGMCVYIRVCIFVMCIHCEKIVSASYIAGRVASVRRILCCILMKTSDETKLFHDKRFYIYI